MFRKSRKRIVATVMAALIVFLIVTLGVIYGSSYYELKKQNAQMLQRYADAYFPEMPMEERDNPERPPEAANQPSEAAGQPPEYVNQPRKNLNQPRPDEPAFRLSTFY